MRPSHSPWIRYTLLLTLVLAAASAQAQDGNLQSALDKTSREVSTFLERISDVRCTEQVSQEKLDRNGHIKYDENATYDYLVLLQGSSNDLLLNESRLPGKHDNPKWSKDVPMLITNGFSTLFLIFHPYYINSFKFTAEPDDSIDGRRMLRVHFAHLSGMRTPAALAVRGRDYPLDLAGTAWIDPDSYMVARIETTLGSDMHDVGLRSLSTEIDYTPVKLPGWSQVYRFPTVATVEVETLRQHWRNVHRFNNYQRFMVGTTQTVAGASGTK